MSNLIMSEILRKYIELNNTIKILSEEIEKLKSELINNSDFVEAELETSEWKFKISKIKKIDFKLKENINENEIKNKYTDCIKIDTTLLKKKADAHDLFQKTESEYIKIVKLKDDF